MYDAFKELLQLVAEKLGINIPFDAIINITIVAIVLTILIPIVVIISAFIISYRERPEDNNKFPDD